MSKSSTKKPKIEFTWAQATRDIVVTSIFKGQLPLFGLIFLAAACIWKMPAVEIAPLINRMFDKAQSWGVYGWICSVFLIVLWWMDSRRLRVKHTAEIKRISGEKRELQEKLSKKKLPSSD